MAAHLIGETLRCRVRSADALPFGRLWYGEPNATSNAIRLVFLIETQPTDHGLRIVTLNLGGLGRVGFVFLSPARPLHSLDAIRVIAWPRFGYAKFHSRSHDAVIRVYDDAGKVIETHEHVGRVQRVVTALHFEFRAKQKAATR